MSITGNTASNPYSSVSDLLSNVRNFKVIESTLREGEQFANAWFSRETKIKIATMLYDTHRILLCSFNLRKLTSQSRDDCEAICKLGLKDAKLACDCGVDGVDVVIGTSQFLREHSLGGKDMTAITKQAIEVIEYIKSRGCEVRFSSEDSFRSDLVDLLSIYRAVNNAGVGRVGVADTVGCASPRQVYDLVRTLRGCVSTDIEVHLTIKNSFTALEAGATHVDTSVLGIGERNGICPLGAFMARMMPTSRDYILSKYKLHQLKAIEDFVAEAVEASVSHTLTTGFCAFTHKAGIHAKAILNSPVHFASRLTGWNAIRSRVNQLGLKMTDNQIKEVTAKIKQMADLKVMTLDESDALIRSFHLDLQNGDGGQMD
ncbi:homocitrate synthase [Durotheca rogersii]|uniref:homocitrate synthase n=1 Tax=Durotheca rogersii TaxID=419775 RepID=UPI002220AA01|nr:homocitrate synthase [Durotheca rogersii]KAI5863041.1 homocitrate synthase [Durotheca rogersii]